MSIWDDPDLAVTDDYVSFDQVGDTVTGVVLATSVHTWDDGSKCPRLLLDVDGSEVNLTAGQTRLKRALAEQRPEAGDTITVTLTEIEKRAGGKTLKHFDVSVVRGAGGVRRAPAVAPAVADAAPALADAVPAVDLSDPRVAAALAAIAAQQQQG